MAALERQASKVYIPVMESNEVVAVEVASLPEEPEDLLEILAAEAAPLGTWFDFARAYLAQGNEKAFTHICEEGIREEVVVEVERFFGSKPIYEQIQFLCGLASLSMAKGREEKDKARKQDLFSTASKYLASAKVLDEKEQLVHLGLGLLHVSKGDLGSARHEFVRATQLENNKRKNVVGHLALAAVHYNLKEYKEALQTYRRALRENPGCPAEVRLGIAACLLKTGDMVAAQAGFERVLALDAGNADAHLGLAVIKFNSPNVQQGLADGLKLLVRAYELDPQHVGTLNMLAHYCLLRGDYDRALTLARSALDVCESDGVRADCLCIMARAHHATGNINEAYKSYSQASRLDTTLPLPHLGLAQWYLSQGSAQDGVINASSELETAIRAAPAFYDALKILGHLIYDHPAKVDKTLPAFREAAGRREDDADMWELLAELLAPRDPQGSLKAYRHVLQLHRRRQAEVQRQRDELRAAAAQRLEAKRAKRRANGGAHATDDLFGSDEEDDDGGDEAAAVATVPDYVVPPRLLNNAAVLLYRAGHVGEALELIKEASAQLAVTTPSVASSSSSEHQRVTLAYNMARAREAMGEYRAAKQAYQDILAQHDGYIDCYLRLACIARRMGSGAEAFQWASRALTLQGGHADALALMSQLYMERRDWHNAHITIKRLLEPPPANEPPSAGQGGQRDSYGRLARANLELASLPGDRHRLDGEEAKKAEDKLTRALDLYLAVLRAEPSNVYAANGLGAVLAEMGKFKDASEVFGEVQAAVASSDGFLHIPDLYINMANVSLASQEYTDALRLYNVALQKLDSSKQAQLLLYLARGYFDSNDLRSSKHCLLRAIHIAPTDYRLRFNAALTMQEFAVRTFRKKRGPNDPTRLPEFQQSQKDLELAIKYFEQLLSKPRDLTQLDSKKLQQHVKFCTDQLSKSEELVEAARTDAAEMEARRAAQEKMRTIAEAKRQLEQLKKDEAKRSLKAEQEALARTALTRAENLKEEWKLKAGVAEGEGGAGKKGKKGKGKKGDGGKGAGKGKKGRDNTEEEGSEGEEDGGAAAADAKEAEAEAVDALFDDEDEEEENGDKAGGSDADDAAPATASGRGRGGRLRKAGQETQDGGEGADGEGLEDDEQGGARTRTADEAGLNDDDEQDGGDGGGGEGGRSAKRSRRTAIEDEEEEEGAGGAGAGGGGGEEDARMEDAGEGQETGMGEGGATGGASRQRADADEVDKLFADDDDE